MALVWDQNKGQYVDLNESLSSYQEEGPVTLSKPMDNPEDQARYNQKLKEMSAPKQVTHEIPEGGDVSSTEGKPGQNPKMSGGAAAAQGVQQSMQSGGGTLDMAGSGLMAAGVYTANPVLIGAGLATTTFSQVQKKKQERENQKYLAEVKKFEARQNALQKLADIGAGLKA